MRENGRKGGKFKKEVKMERDVEIRDRWMETEIY